MAWQKHLCLNPPLPAGGFPKNPVGVFSQLIILSRLASPKCDAVGSNQETRIDHPSSGLISSCWGQEQFRYQFSVVQERILGEVP